MAQNQKETKSLLETISNIGDLESELLEDAEVKSETEEVVEETQPEAVEEGSTFKVWGEDEDNQGAEDSEEVSEEETETDEEKEEPVAETEEDDGIEGSAPISKESFESFDDVWGLIENLRPKNPNKKSTIDIDIHNPAQAKASMAKFGLKPGTVGKAGGASTIKISGKNKDLLAYLTSKDYDMDKEDIKDLFGKDILEAYGLDEGKMKELHGHIEDGKSAEEIIKLMKLKKTPDMIKFIKGLMK